jgi:hypothetical protein
MSRSLTTGDIADRHLWCLMPRLVELHGSERAVDRVLLLLLAAVASERGAEAALDLVQGTAARARVESDRRDTFIAIDPPLERGGAA